MASSALPKPGTTYGPCVKECGHPDCAESRRMAESKCRICGEVIGYNKHFYRDERAQLKLCTPSWKHLVHAVCLEEQIEAEQAEVEAATPD